VKSLLQHIPSLPFNLLIVSQFLNHFQSQI